MSSPVFDLMFTIVPIFVFITFIAVFGLTFYRIIKFKDVSKELIKTIKPISEEEKDYGYTIMKCPSCGASIEDGLKECPYCGSKLTRKK